MLTHDNAAMDSFNLVHGASSSTAASMLDGAMMTKDAGGLDAELRADLEEMCARRKGQRVRCIITFPLLRHQR